MSEFWSFYKFHQLIQEADGKVNNRLMPHNTDGEELKPSFDLDFSKFTWEDEDTPVPPSQKPATQGTPDYRSELPRAGRVSGKGEYKQLAAAKSMSDQATAEKAIEIIKQSRTLNDKIMAFNDVNGNSKTGYWIMIDKLKELEYDVPEIPMDDHPRWVPTGDGGFDRGYWRMEKVKDPKTNKMVEVEKTNGGSPDGPYVTINQPSNPYSIEVKDTRDIKEILKTASRITNSGSELDQDSPNRDAWLDSIDSKNAGFRSMDRDAGAAGEAMNQRFKSTGQMQPPMRRARAPSRQDILKTIEAQRKPDKTRQSLRDMSHLDNKDSANISSDDSGSAAKDIEQEMSNILGHIQKVGDAVGVDSTSYMKEVENLIAWIEDTLGNKRSRINQTLKDDLMDMLAQAQDDPKGLMGGEEPSEDALEWNSMNEWLHYLEVLEHIYE